MTDPSTYGSCQSEGRRPETGMRDCAATRTLSYTEMPGKMFVIWNVFARHAEYEQHQHPADHDVVSLHVRRHLLLQQEEERAADDGADERPEAADHDHDEELARDAPVQEIGRGVGRATRVERAREPGQDGRDQAHAHLVALDVVAEKARPVLVLADGHEHLAEVRTDDHAA